MFAVAVLDKPNAHCTGLKVTVPCMPSNRGNQQCLCLRVGRSVGMRSFMTFDPAQHARHDARCAICLFSQLVISMTFTQCLSFDNVQHHKLVF